MAATKFKFEVVGKARLRAKDGVVDLDNKAPEMQFADGDVVGSDKDLRPIWPNKFKLAEPGVKLSKGKPVGLHRLRDQTTRDIPSFDDGVLHDDAERVQAVSVSQIPESEEETPDKNTRTSETEEEATGGSDEEPVNELGEDVTKDFPKAEEAGLLVIKDGPEHHIVHPDDPTTPLKTVKKRSVDSAVAAVAKKSEK